MDVVKWSVYLCEGVAFVVRAVNANEVTFSDVSV